MTTSPIQTKLLSARKKYSECAKLVEGQITAAGALTETLSERIIGLGVAADWLRRAAEMSTVSFIGDQLNQSERKVAFVELIRFGFAWSAANAIFARSGLLRLIGLPPKENELSRFRMLFDAAGLSKISTDQREALLHAILLQQTSPRLPSTAPGTVVTTLHAVNAKYIPPDARKRGVGKLIDTAAQTGSLSALDLPVLLYAFRNWSVHGNALDGSFGGRSKFKTYIETLTITLAEVHVGTAALLKQRL